ncbi:unnamed protein product [Gadus morhua 'NCC']
MSRANISKSGYSELMQPECNTLSLAPHPLSSLTLWLSLYAVHLLLPRFSHALAITLSIPLSLSPSLPCSMHIIFPIAPIPSRNPLFFSQSRSLSLSTFLPLTPTPPHNPYHARNPRPPLPHTHTHTHTHAHTRTRTHSPPPDV